MLSILARRSSATASRHSSFGGMSATVRAMSTSETFPIRVPFETHLCDGPQVTEATVTKDELLEMHKTMYLIRRMEISCDTEYKNRNIRGFCHLYDGQEAVGVGMQHGIDKEDDVIGTYRCHGLQLIRGDSIRNIMAELFGFKQGSSKGKGGSMHFYSKKNHFWGGAGIVGAQVPVGVGIAFANKYRVKEGEPMNICVSMFGDGAANQGQIWEAMNIAKLWNLPAVALCENNSYGMGTSVERHSSNTEYFKQGGVVIPGIKCDGMDVLAVRECMKWVKDRVGGGQGPLYVEMKTYRYHGHSMSDPGLTYRDRDEVSTMRQTRDCIELVRQRLIEAGWASASEIKSIERDLRNFVASEIEEAKKGTQPESDAKYDDVYYQERPAFIRGVDMQSSKHF